MNETSLIVMVMRMMAMVMTMMRKIIMIRIVIIFMAMLIIMPVQKEIITIKKEKKRKYSSQQPITQRKEKSTGKATKTPQHQGSKFAETLSPSFPRTDEFKEPLTRKGNLAESGKHSAESYRSLHNP